MATKIVSTDIAGNVKPSFASSSLIGLTVRANGEESTKVLDMNGNMVDAQIPTPVNPPFVYIDTVDPTMGKKLIWMLTPPAKTLQ